MLKWNAPEGERMLSRTKVPGPPNSVPAYAADIVACLSANPEALTAEQWTAVLSALTPETQDGITDAVHLKARAEKAERERDEARATASRYLQSWNNEANDIRETLNKVAAREKTALSRIAKLEAVVSAADEWERRDALYRNTSTGVRWSWVCEQADATLAAVRALRTLDAQDSGGYRSKL